MPRWPQNPFRREAQPSAHPPILLCAAAGILLALTLSSRSRGDDAPAVAKSPSASLIALGLKFDGAMTCNDAKCHGAPKSSPGRPDNEYTVWFKQDHHSKAFKTLLKPDVKKDPALGTIGQKLNIATSERRPSCHALNAPDNLQGQKFNLKEGVTCGACHGPSEKWLEPHSTEGWHEQQRKAMDHEALLKQWGYYDTKPLLARAQKCTSCHLAIDADMDAHAKALGDYPKLETAKLPAEASAIADAVDKFDQAVENFAPDKKAAVALGRAIASDADTAKDYGLHGVEQQAFAVYDLTANYETAENAPSKNLADAVAKLFAPMDPAAKLDPDAYAKDLAAVLALLPSP